MGSLLHSTNRSPLVTACCVGHSFRSGNCMSVVVQARNGTSIADAGGGPLVGAVAVQLVQGRLLLLLARLAQEPQVRNVIRNVADWTGSRRSY